jgi:hypothetical protein
MSSRKPVVQHVRRDLLLDVRQLTNRMPSNVATEQIDQLTMTSQEK